MDNVWPRIRENYSQWVMLGFTVFAIVYFYFASTNLGALVFLWGLAFLAHLRSFKGFVPVAALTGLLLLYGFFRSDFVAMIAHGAGIGEAYATSKRYFQAPMLQWFTIWALVFACRDLPEDKAEKPLQWLGWGVIGLNAIQIVESLSRFGIRTVVNNTFHDGNRPEMLVVRTSNLNAVLMMLFWPLAYYFIRKRNYGVVIFMAFSLILTAFAVDTNSQIMAVGLGVVVFAAVRFWPRALDRIGVIPERILAVMSAAAIALFPPFVIWLVKSGLALKIKTELLPSWADRIDIWSYAVARGSEKPWLGWGYEASRQFEPQIPDHPHSLALQAWLELGVPGLLTLAAIWFCIFWFMAPKGEAHVKSDGLLDLNAAVHVAENQAAQMARPYFLAAAVGYFAINMVSFGLWRMWYYCLGALAVGICLLAVKAVDRLMKLQN